MLSPGIWRYETANAKLLEGEWWVMLPGQPELVSPRGVRPDDDYDSRARPLGDTLHEVMTHLGELEMMEREAAAQQLASHCRLFGAPDLCGEHGLPLWHDGPRVRRASSRQFGSLNPSCAPGTGPDGALGLKVSAVTKFVKHLRGLEHIADHLRLRRERTPDWMVDDVLKGGILDEHYVRRVREARERGDFDQDATRHLLTYSLDRVMASSWLAPTMRWPKQRRPELALVANTTCALYVADVLAHVGAPDDADRTYVCSACSMPFTPKRRLKESEGTYCRKPECQRERNRLKQVRRRERETANGKHREEA